MPTTLPWLAKSWEILDEGKRYVFHLDERAKWSDGKPVTAEDVVVTWNLTMKYTMSSTLVGVLKEVRAVDTYTVEFITTQPWARWEYDFATTLVLPAHIWSKLEDPLSYNIINNPSEHVTSGPFIYDSFQQNEWYLFKRRQGYWKTEFTPKIDGVLFKCVSDVTTYPFLVETGEVDLALPFPIDLISQVKDKPSLKIYIDPPFTTMEWFGINTRLYPLSLKEVRHAIELAIDKERIARDYWMGYAIPGNSCQINFALKPEFFVPGAVWPGLGKSHEANVAEANRILDELGFQKGADGIRVTPNGTRLSFKFVVWNSPLTAIRIRAAEEMVKNLNEIGIEISRFESLSVMDAYQRALFPGEKDFGFDTQIIDAGRDQWPSLTRTTLLFVKDPGLWHAIGWNTSGAQKATEYANQAYKCINYDELCSNIRELVKIFADELPAFPVVFLTMTYYVYRTDRFTNWDTNLMATWRGMPPMFFRQPAVSALTPVAQTKQSEPLPKEIIALTVAIAVVVIVVAVYLIIRSKKKK